MLSGKIYLINSPNTEKVYIGSTVLKYLSLRMAIHRAGYKNYLNGGIRPYCTSYEILKCGDAKIQLISEHQVNSRKELERLEGIEIGNHPNAINKNIAGQTRNEYAKKYYYKHTDKKRNYYLKNRAKRIEYQKNYYMNKVK